MKKNEDNSLSNTNEIFYIINRFRNFLNRFKTIENKRLYSDKIKEILLNQNICILQIDLLHIAVFDAYLYFKLIGNPSRIISIFDCILNKILKKSGIINQKFSKKKIKTVFVSNVNNIVRGLNIINPTSINKLITIQGFVLNRSCIIPDMVSAFFKCENCFFELYSFLEYGNILEPVYCFRCKMFNSFQLIYHRCSFSDKQYIQLQPTYKNKDSNICSSITIIIYDQIINKVEIGDFIEIVGISRATSIKGLDKIHHNIIFKFYIDVLSLKKLKKKNNFFFHKHNFIEEKIHHGLSCSIEKKTIFASLSQNPLFYRIIMDNHMPNSFGYEIIKRSVFLQLVAANSGMFEQSRKQINLVLLGCPNIDKRLFLKTVTDFANESLFVYGQTFINNNYNLVENRENYFSYLSNEFENFKFYDKNILCIYEFNKIPESGINFIKEAVSFQTISTAKAGTVCSIRTKMSILATMDIEQTKNKVNNNVVLKSSTFETKISIFDVIYFLKPINTTSIDEKMYQNKIMLLECLNQEQACKYNTSMYGLGFNSEFLHTYSGEINTLAFPKYSELTYRDFLKWKNLVSKVIRSGIQKGLIYNNDMSGIICRLSEANARMRMSNTISLFDIKFSLILILESIKSIN
nr:minichromosome maintenance complex component 4-like protein [Cryptomonas sp.]